MKKVIILGIFLLLAISVTGVVFADGTGTGFYTQLTFNQLPTPTSSFADLDLGMLDYWIIDYTGAVTVSSTNTNATLFGNYDGFIWKYEYSADNGATWTEIDKLVQDVTAVAGTTSNVNESNVSSVVLYANKLRVSYNATLTADPGSFFSNASGTGTISAVTIPEPSGIAALAGMLGVFVSAFSRRKK